MDKARKSKSDPKYKKGDSAGHQPTYTPVGTI